MIPRKLQGPQHEGYIDALTSPSLTGWIIHKKKRGCIYNVTTICDNNVVQRLANKKRLDVFQAKNCKIFCGFELPLTDIIPPSQVIGSTSGSQFTIRLQIEDSDGELVEDFELTIPREQLLQQRFQTNLETSPLCFSGWHVDLFSLPSYAPRFYLAADGWEVELPPLPADDLVQHFPRARGWRFSHPYVIPHFLARNHPRLVIKDSGDIVQTLPVQCPPIIYGMDQSSNLRSKNLSGWAINTHNTDLRPTVCVIDSLGQKRSSRCTLYRKDLRNLCENFDGFAGFALLTEDLESPLHLEISNRQTSILHALDSLR